METLAFDVVSASFPDESTIDCRLRAYAVRKDRLDEHEARKRLHRTSAIGFVLVGFLSVALAYVLLNWTAADQAVRGFSYAFPTKVVDGKVLVAEDHEPLREGDRIIAVFNSAVEPDEWNAAPRIEPATGPMVVLTVYREGEGEKKFRVDNTFGKVSEVKRPSVRGTDEDLIHRSIYSRGNMSPAEMRSVRKGLIEQRRKSVRMAEANRPT